VQRLNSDGDSPGGPAPGEARNAALRLAQEAAARVPAYARFLREAGYDAARLRTFDDFCALPPTDKASYLLRYPLDQRCLNGALGRTHMITLSSGTSGPASFWPRYPEHDPPLWASHLRVLHEHFRVRERTTLLVVAAAMGPWGYCTSMTQGGQHVFADLGALGTVVTPGLDQDAALRLIEDLGPHYDQTVLVSYPAMVPALLEAGTRRGIDWRALNTALFVSGEDMSEAQREHVLRLLGRDPDQLVGCVNTFGASEVGGMIGYETHLCLLLRRLCARSPALATSLFGSTVIPSINQYSPLRFFLQIQAGDVLLTQRGAVPLIRYDTHDRGGAISLEDMIGVCRAHGYDLLAELRTRGFGPEYLRPQPFLYAFGRSDAVIIHGGNVYLHEVAAVLEQPELHRSNTGNFELSLATAADGRLTLKVAVELEAQVAASEPLRAVYQRGVLEGLLQVSSRFRAAHEASSGRLAVEVRLLPHGALAATGPKQRRIVLPSEAEPPDRTARGERDS
jgi:phenylacetate-CoA ligase